jgi:N-acetylglucosamine kinase-like BadF-type ATPase
MRLSDDIDNDGISEEDKLKAEQAKADEIEANDLIEQLQTQTFRNREMRIEFAKIILQLASNNNPRAKKLVYKMSEFAKYWENDEMIDEEEWRKLNNTQDMIESVQIKKYKSKFSY